MAFDQNSYIVGFVKENYDRIVVQVPKGKRNELKEIAADKGKSVNQLIIFALENTYDVSLGTNKELTRGNPCCPVCGKPMMECSCT